MENDKSKVPIKDKVLGPVVPPPPPRYCPPEQPLGAGGATPHQATLAQDDEEASVIIARKFASRAPNVVQDISRYQLVYSLAGLVFGIMCVTGGVVLFLNGVVGSTSWTAKILGAESNISDAAPGALLFVTGLFVTFVTRYVVKVRE